MSQPLRVHFLRESRVHAYAKALVNVSAEGSPARVVCVVLCVCVLCTLLFLFVRVARASFLPHACLFRGEVCVVK